VIFANESVWREDKMQYYESIENDDTIAIIFEGNEIPLGFKVMSDLLKIMEMNGGTQSPEMEHWLKEARKKFYPSSETLQ